MISEEQKKKYEEECVKRYPMRTKYLTEQLANRRRGFRAGIEHAHPIAHSEGWNEALDALKNHYEGEIENARKYRTHPEMLTVRYTDIFEELKRLKR